MNPTLEALLSLRIRKWRSGVGKGKSLKNPISFPYLTSSIAGASTIFQKLLKAQQRMRQSSCCKHLGLCCGAELCPLPPLCAGCISACGSPSPAISLRVLPTWSPQGHSLSHSFLYLLSPEHRVSTWAVFIQPSHYRQTPSGAPDMITTKWPFRNSIYEQHLAGLHKNK